MTPYERPHHHLRAIRAQYPDAWIQVEQLRAQRGKSLPAWPEWCYLPLAGAYAIVSGAGEERVPMERAPAIGVLGALAAWRVTQGIYEYDPTLLEALVATPVDGDLPIELLQRLPDWCVYCMTPGLEFEAGVPLHGFFAHLEWDEATRRQELRFALDVTKAGSDQLVIPLPLHLVGGGIAESLAAAVAAAERQAAAQGVDIGAKLEAIQRFGTERLAPLVSIVLYLCSEAAEIHERAVEQAARQHPRQPPRAYPKAPTTWEVGYRLGAALRLAEQREEASPAGGAHARPRAHIRRAHWHTYLTGTGRSVPQLRWLPSIPVNVDQGEIVPTIRKVE